MRSTLLSIDDSPTVRAVIRIFLKGRPLEVVDAESAERGITVLGLMPINLIIADINMPGMDGIEFVRRLRADSRPNIRSLPVVLLTPERGGDLRQRGVEAGANAFISKPVSHFELNKTIDRLLPQG